MMECTNKVDCPTYFDCYNEETGNLAEITPGYSTCQCYGPSAKFGDACTESGAKAAIIMVAVIICMICSFAVCKESALTMVKLKACNALDLSKPGNLTLALILPVGAFLFLYQLCLLLIILNKDPSAFLSDIGRTASTGLLVMFLQVCSLQIAITWITIGGTAGKKGIQFKDYPPRLKQAYYVCQFLKGLTVVVVFTCAAIKNTQLLRFYTFVQFVGIGTFYWFGSKSLAAMLTPAKGEGVSDEKYKIMCEPAVAIAKTGKKCAICSFGYLFLQAAASPMIGSIDPKKSFLGMFVFELSLILAAYMVSCCRRRRRRCCSCRCYL
jgi:hypothetical protein